jgi:hypothetical protein
MKTQCPKCLGILEIPDSYTKKLVKCPGCKSEFSAFEYKDVPFASHGFLGLKAESPAEPKPPRKLGQRVILIEPSPFDFGFQATFGVLAALFIISCILGFIGFFIALAMKYFAK